MSNRLKGPDLIDRVPEELQDILEPTLKMDVVYGQQKQDRELTVAQIMNSLLPNSDLN